MSIYLIKMNVKIFFVLHITDYEFVIKEPNAG